MNLNQLEWKTIYYHEELDTDGSIIDVEWAQEAEYRGGHLVRTIFDQTYKEHMHQVRSESLTFVPN